MIMCFWSLQKWPNCFPGGYIFLPVSRTWQSNYFTLFKHLVQLVLKPLAIPAGIFCHCSFCFVLDDTIYSQILLIQTFHSRQVDLFLLQAQLIHDYSTSVQAWAANLEYTLLPSLHTVLCPLRGTQVFWLSNPISSRKKNHALSNIYILHANYKYILSKIKILYYTWYITKCM